MKLHMQNTQCIGIECSKISFPFIKEGVSLYEIWKYDSKIKQQDCSHLVLFRGMKKISRALIYLLSHFLKLQK